jgi:hypothetical protein
MFRAKWSVCHIIANKPGVAARCHPAVAVAPAERSRSNFSRTENRLISTSSNKNGDSRSASHVYVIFTNVIKTKANMYASPNTQSQTPASPRV